LAQKIARAVLTLIGAGLGVAIVEGVNELLVFFGLIDMHVMLLEWGVVLIYIAGALVFAIITYLLAPRLIEYFTRFISAVETKLADMSMAEIFFGVVGLIVGLVIAFLVSTLTAKMSLNWLAFIINAVLYFTFGYLGWSVVTKRKGEINTPSWFKRGAKDRAGKASVMARPNQGCTGSGRPQSHRASRRRAFAQPGHRRAGRLSHQSRDRAGSHARA
jgi:uncharacterized protein YacL